MMPNLHGVLKEINSTYPTDDESSVDIVRRKYLAQLAEKTDRNVIAYYSGFLTNPQHPQVSINEDDKNGFMLCCNGLDYKKGLDLILHTPGGEVHATASLINYLNEMFDGNIRAIVPQIAMSAGTMIAISCKTILMGKHSNLGPVDPQINGSPAFAVIEQFKRARNDIIKYPRTAPVWYPMLAQLGASYLEQCDLAIDYSKDFVTQSLTKNMLADDPDVKTKVQYIAKKLTDLSENKSHERRFFYQDCIHMGLKIEMLEDDQMLQDLVLTVHHTYMHVFGNSGAVKIIENDRGTARVWNADIK